MNESTEPQDPSQKQTDADNAQAASKQDMAAIASDRAKAAQLVAQIESDAEKVAEARVLFEKSKEESDQILTSAIESVVALRKQVEDARVSATELGNLATDIQNANVQSKETASQATVALESARLLADSASKNASLIEGLKTQVEQAAQVAEKRSEHIEKGRLYADEVRAKIDGVFTQAQQSATNAEAQFQATRASSDKLNDLYAAAQKVNAKTDSIAESVAATLTTVEGHADITKKLADIAKGTEAKVAKYESQLDTQIEKSLRQQDQIDKLLAGATDAGLASAFDKRSMKFRAPEKRWQYLFVLSLVCLIGLAAWHLYSLSYQKLDQLPDWQQVARLLAIKVPVAATLVWLAIYAARQAALAKRMEEEYAFKATISMSFDGYRKQMEEVGKDFAADSPLATLCRNTLREIAAPPGRVYDRQKMDPNIATSLAEVAKPVVEAVKTIADKQPGPKV